MRQITKEDIRAMDDEARRAAFRRMGWRERQPLAFGFCGNRNAEFPAVLADWLDVGLDGDVSFNYAGQCGALTSVLHSIDIKLDRIRGERAKAEALKRLADYVSKENGERQVIALWWSAHVDAITARIELDRRAA